LYTDSAHRFRFVRPALWTLTPEADGALLTDSNGASTIRVTVAPSAAGETAQTRAAALVTATPALAITPPERQIADQSWVQLTGQVTGTDGAVRKVADYVTLRGGQVYLIECVSPIASYDATNNLVFQPLFASFAFL
ncbi:MAG: hypothetical protein IVW57_17460, partial [Ktedonobacterales bacterium]|nr:hypothetical protein [Ktedonobacterales bacterium]